MFELLNEDTSVTLDHMIKKGIKVDAIITDIPYGVTQNKIDVFPDEKFFKNIWKITDTFITTIQGKAMIKMINALPKNIKWYDLVWDKEISTGFLNAKKQPLRRHENIIVMYKKKPTYNPQKWDSGKYYNAKKGLFSYGKDDITNNNYGKIKKNVQENTTMRYPTSILKFKKPHPSTALHPTMKPVDLYIYLVKTYTNENDIVFDPYMGCGTTGVACEKTNRRFIGNELDEKYFNVAAKRLKEGE